MTVSIFLPQVTRIPITGPAPFNTLVCVTVETLQGAGEVSDGVLKRFTQRVTTPFRLVGFDQRVPPAFDHSTTAWLSSTGPTQDGNWIIAVDSVKEAGFDPVDGGYYIDLAGALSVDGAAPGTCFAFGGGGTICFYTPKIQVTSWVLCYEPPVAPLQHGHIHRLNDLVQAGFSPADLARVPLKSPGQTREKLSSHTTVADQALLILQQSRLPLSISVAPLENNANISGDVSAGCRR